MIISVAHCKLNIINSTAYKIKYYKFFINEFTFLFDNLCPVVYVAVTTIEAFVRALLLVELPMSDELVPHFVFPLSFVAPSTGLQTL